MTIGGRTDVQDDDVFVRESWLKVEARNRKKYMPEIENAKIKHVSITMEDHGCLTFFLTLDGGSWGCNFGGYCIGHGCLGADEFTSENSSGLVAMMKIMDVVGVEKWEDLVGKYVRVRSVHTGSRITTIGNIIKDKWFDIEDFFENYGKEKE